MKEALTPIAIGDRFGRLEVIGEPDPKDKYHRYTCRCDCGRVTKPRASNLRRSVRSCGCAGKGTTSHGQYGTPTYISWQAMKSRINYPKNVAYYNYGARGIRYDPRWEDFEVFLADMGERPEGTSLDRIDVNGNYEKSNCRWASSKEQAQNKRTVTKLENQNRQWVMKAISAAHGAATDARALIAEGRKDEALELLLTFTAIFAPEYKE